LWCSCEQQARCRVLRAIGRPGARVYQAVYKFGCRPETILSQINFFRHVRLQHRASMLQYRTIPILPEHEWSATSQGPEPKLSGKPDRIDRVIEALQEALSAELGLRGPRSFWLRELRLDEEEAFLALRPGLCGNGHRPAEVAFATLRRLLPDTDIYIGAGHA
jgi:hypothetical protein